MTSNLVLRAIHPSLRERVQESFEEGNARGFLVSSLYGESTLGLVADNLFPLKERGIYEQCLLSAFTDCKGNNREWSEGWMDLLFRHVDPSKLREAGDPLPCPGPFRIYRGVAGMGPSRRLRGFSWTGSLDVACWFATRSDLRSPAVLTALVNEEDVLAYRVV